MDIVETPWGAMVTMVGIAVVVVPAPQPNVEASCAPISVGSELFRILEAALAESAPLQLALETVVAAQHGSPSGDGQATAPRAIPMRPDFGSRCQRVHTALTEREREVLCLVAGGATNRAIASRLFISPKTASVHVSRILTKLDATTRTEAAALAHASGLVRSSSTVTPRAVSA